MELRKQRAITGVVIITLIVATWISTALISRYMLGMEAFRDSAGQAYKNFGTEIEHLDEELQLLSKGESKVITAHSGDYVSWYVLDALRSSRYNLEKMDKRYTFGNVDFFYMDISQRLERIKSDRKISEIEHRFIKDLSTFTKEVAKFHKQHLESVDYKGETDYFNKEKIFNKNIAWVYYGFYFETDSLYNSETYKFMSEFEGDYSDFDYDAAEKACMALYDKFIAGEPLKYSNKNEVYKQNLIFKSRPLTSDIRGLSDLTETVPVYELTYHKDTQRLVIHIDSAYKNTETTDTALMDKKAEELARTIKKDAKLLSSEYGSEPNSLNNKAVSFGYYDYLINPNGKTDEDRNMTIHLMPDGTILYISMPLGLKK